ncbi:MULTISPECIES: RnfABCDGE type electron transport complex subunit G [Porphyromonadaceae]|uniref:Ion-translocating oxidoreductase complex subunit G n=1 Tax=Sanguibacteroides justesenii TaxID=1547597 RepID=A0A0C3RDB2_9PORP|nr:MULTISPECIES: RnfABCDGE type electron transport complex subunit G [Porphyromonadaceae]KIO42724.1 electron transporter RnfG [Sanguibacteroides justesenii]KIO46451.1 electron transporter RnfG [Sanguibacteroides justesenii]PXZ42778.1 RnfABCDGE type electron transport complex subunit G [Sanguibacteroides justesenii]
MGKKLESTFKNMVLVLSAITLISSAAVGFVNEFTSGLIDKAKLEKQVTAIRNVVAAFDNDPMAEAWTEKTPDGGELIFYPAKKAGELVGTAIKTYSNNGFSGKVWLMVGFNPDGTIHNYSVLEHKETPGLGSKMDSWFTRGGKGNVTGKKPGKTGLKVTKDGGDVDAITAATISSRAFLDAINRAAAALNGADTQSGATQQIKTEN